MHTVHMVTCMHKCMHARSTHGHMLRTCCCGCSPSLLFRDLEDLLDLLPTCSPPARSALAASG